MKLSKRGTKYQLTFQVNDGRFRLICFENLQSSQELKRTIQLLIAIKESRGVMSQDLQRSVDAMPARIVKVLLKSGVITNLKAAGKTAITECLKDFIDSMRMRRVCEKHRLQSEAKLNKIFVSCGFEVLSDINQQRFVRYINDLSVSVKTQRDIISLMRTFSKWMYETGILPKDDFKMIKLPKVLESDRVHARRAFTADEIAKLINVAENGEPFRGVSGQERALIYRLAVESGLRSNELRTLQVSSFDFKSSTVKILDSNEKSRRGATIELRKSTADLLKNFLRNKSPQAAAFAIKALKTGMMIRKDLAAAGITYEIDGKFADFHSLRHSTASLLIASGANVKAVQQIMRHATAELTLSKYSHLYAGQQRDAIEALPEFIYQENQSIKTGTNDSENLVPDLCHFGANGGTQSHTETHNYQDTITAQNSDKVAFAAIKAGSEELAAEKRPRAFNLRPYNHP